MSQNYIRIINKFLTILWHNRAQDKVLRKSISKNAWTRIVYIECTNFQFASFLSQFYNKFCGMRPAVKYLTIGHAMIANLRSKCY